MRYHWPSALGIVCAAVCISGVLLGVASIVAFTNALLAPDHDRTVQEIGVLSLLAAGCFGVLALFCRDAHRRWQRRLALLRGFEITKMSELQEQQL